MCTISLAPIVGAPRLRTSDAICFSAVVSPAAAAVQPAAFQLFTGPRLDVDSPRDRRMSDLGSH